MSKRIRINNDILVEWTVNITDPDGDSVELSSFNLGLDLTVGTKIINIEDFTVSGNLISFVFYGSQQQYTGSYIMRLYDKNNTSLTYDVKTAFVLVNHSWQSGDVITEPATVDVISNVKVDQIIASPGQKGEKGDKGDPGVVSATASVDSSTGTPAVTVTLQNQNLDFHFTGLKGKDGSGGGGGGGGEGGEGDKGDPGRSVIGIDYWFKLSSQGQGVSAPALTVANPEDDGWRLTSSNPTASLPYLWCFSQVNYDSALATGYTYSRSSAYCVRRYNSDSSQEFSDLERMIESLRSEMETEMEGYEADLLRLNSSLNALKSLIEGSIATDLNYFKNRFLHIDGTDVKKIEDNNQGLWGVLTSYTDDTVGQKSFSDIVLDAKKAKQTLSVGSQFFGTRTSAEVTLDGLKGQINLKATKDYVDSTVSQAQFSVDAAALKSVISKGQKCWKKGTLLYPYDLYLSGYSGTISEYEDYMESAPSSGGPSDGPFELVVTVSQFSLIKQTVDGIEASVDKAIYAWSYNNGIYAYEYFEDSYEERAPQYSEYTYEEYVTDVLGCTKVEVSNLISGVIQTSTELKSMIGDVNYIWRKNNGDGTYSYERYAVPSNKTRDQYISEKTVAGWSLYDFSPQMSVIDQTADAITLGVKKASLVWINEALPATNPNYCLDYDYWLTEYESSSYSGTYEQYVGANYSSYVLTKVSNAMSRIKVTNGSISSAIERIDGIDNSITAIEQNADNISLMASKGAKAWKNTANDVKAYDYFLDEWEALPVPKDTYETWVASTKQYSLEDVINEIGGIRVKSDKVWAGVKDRNDDGEISASISVVARMGTQTEQGVSKIVLDAQDVIVNGNLSTGIVNAGFANISSQLVVGKMNEETGTLDGTVISGGSITTQQIAAGAITTDKIATGAITADKIAAGAISTNRLTVLDGNDNVILDSGSNLNYPLLCGSDNPNTAATKVSALGKLTTRDLDAYGGVIGGFRINSHYLQTEDDEDGDLKIEDGGFISSTCYIDESNRYIGLGTQIRNGAPVTDSLIRINGRDTLPKGIWIEGDGVQDAIYCEKGSFAGLRPRTRAVFGGSSASTLSVNWDDFNLYISNDSAMTLSLPSDAEVGHTLHIIKNGSGVLRVSCSSSTKVIHKGIITGSGYKEITSTNSFIVLMYIGENFWALSVHEES